MQKKPATRVRKIEEFIGMLNRGETIHPWTRKFDSRRMSQGVAALKAGNPQRSPRLSAGERRSMLAYRLFSSLAAIRA